MTTRIEDEINMIDMLAGGLSGGRAGAERAIDRQQSDGQRRLAESTQLPTKGLIGERDKWKALGVKILDAGESSARDPMFCRVELPDGWRKVATDHYLWSDLLD